MRTKLSALAAMAGLTVSCFTAQANSINITQTLLPGLVTVSGRSQPTWSDPLAEVTGSQGDTQLFNWLLTQVPAGFPTPVDTILQSGTSRNLGDLSAYAGGYLVVHWGNGDAGSKFFDPNPKGGFNQVFFLGAGNLDNLNLEVPSFSGYYKNGQQIRNGTLQVGGLSFWRIYDPPSRVPEAASTAALLGLGLAGVGVFRRLLPTPAGK
jgi:hypothetical protein